MDAVLHRVSSPTFVGRADELAALDGALGRAAAGVPAFTFIAGESGRRQEPARRRARGPRAPAPARACSSATASSSAGPRSPTRRWSTRCGRSRAGLGRSPEPAARHARRARRAAARARAGRRSPRTPAATRRASSRRCSRCSSGSAARPLSCSCSRTSTGPTPRRATSSPSSCAARARSRCASSSPTAPTSCTAATRCARCWPSWSASPGVERVGAGALQPRRARRAGVGDPRRAGARRSSRTACSSAARATRSTRRSCSPRRRTTRASSCPRRSATCWSTASSGCRPPPRRSCGSPPSSTRCATRCWRSCASCAPAELLAGLREAVAHQVLVTGPRDMYAFRHALVGEAVYSDLLPGERSALHARLAETVERDPRLLGDVPATKVAALLACHWNAAHDVPRALGAPWRPAWPPSTCSRSARRSGTSSARSSCGTACPTPRSARAATAPTCCASRPPPPRTRARSCARSRSCARRSRRSTPPADPLRAAFLLERLGHYLRGAGETEEGFAAYERAMGLRAARRQRAAGPAAGALCARGMMLRGRHAEAAEAAEAAIAMAERIGDDAIHGRALNTLGLSRARARRRRRGRRAAAALARRSRSPPGRPSSTCRR